VLPDWCCEILSPRTARDDKRLKLPLFARSGVTWSWLVDPVLRLVEVYQTLNGLPALVTTAQEDEGRVLPPFELEIPLGGWWLPGPAPTE
jgi:Uma2 family endonuclease